MFGNVFYEKVKEVPKNYKMEGLMNQENGINKNGKTILGNYILSQSVFNV